MGEKGNGGAKKAGPAKKKKESRVHTKIEIQGDQQRRSQKFRWRHLQQKS